MGTHCGNGEARKVEGKPGEWGVSEAGKQDGKFPEKERALSSVVDAIKRTNEV